MRRTGQGNGTSASPQGAITREWLRGELSTLLGLPSERIDAGERFNRYGLDSAKATALIAHLSAWLGRPLLPTLAWEHPTLDALADFIGDGPPVERRGTPPRPAPAERPIEPAREPIAVVGIACRFPGGADSPEQFWDLLRDGVDTIREVPPDRWALASYYDEDRAAPGKMNTRWGGFLDRVDGFEPLFFGISPREACQMDPQQRIMLELSWEALEDTGIIPGTLKGTATGVFIGAMWSDYARLMSTDPEVMDQYSATGQDTSIIAGRISYTFGLQGPSLVVNTACSSSLVAVHLACQSLIRGESTMAIAGGIHVIASPLSTVAMTKFGAMSPRGRCRAFDASADGYVRGEGGGAVILKPLSRAILDGDRIYCLLLSSAVNNDGFSNGLTAPNPKAQEEVLRLAYRQAGVAPDKVDYVETHGPGTNLGDPIEAGALGAVLGAGRPRDRPLRIGSVKTNLGHLEAGSGVAGLVKVSLAIQHQAIPKSLHFERPNPHIPMEALGLQVQQELAPFPFAGEPAVAGVISFGFGGTNCHVVVQGLAGGRAHLLPLGAERPAELRRRVLDMLPVVADLQGEAELEGLCRAAARRLSQGRHRTAFVASSPQEMFERLTQRIKEGTRLPRTDADPAPRARPRVVFVCSGQGSQWLGMGRTLLRTEPVFRAELVAFDRAIQELTGWSVLEQLAADPSRSRLKDVEVVQPVLLSVQAALGALWRSWGVEPDAVIGQSMGEIGAAYLAGVLSVEDAALIVCTRGRLTRQCSRRGAMAVISLPPDETAELLARHPGALSIGAYNSPRTTVLSGDEGALEALLVDLETRGVYFGRINAGYASHSHHMDELRAKLLEELQGLKPRRARIQMLSTVTLRTIVGPECGAGYWFRNLREPVHFAQAVEALSRGGEALFVELSAHPILMKAIEETMGHHGRTGMALPSFRRDADEDLTLLETLGALYTSGVDICWDALYPPEGPELPLTDLEGEAAQTSRAVGASVPVLLPVSAKSPEALQAKVRSFAAWLRSATCAASVADIGYTAALRRTHHEHGVAVVGRSRAELAEALEAISADDAAPASLPVDRGAARARPGVVFVFPARSAAWLGVGRRLLQEEEGFREAIVACDVALRPHTGWSLLAQLESGEAASRLGEGEIIEPLSFALEVAIAALWASWGIMPDAVIGHGIGEVAAAHGIGALSLVDAARIAAALGRARHDGITRRAPEPGEAAGGEVFGPAVRDALAGLAPTAGRVPLYSATAAGWIGGEQLDADHWVALLQESAPAAGAAREAPQGSLEVLLQIGLDPSPTSVIEAALQGLGRPTTTIASLRWGEEERACLLRACAALYPLGVSLEWGRLYPRGGRTVSLPTYPWQRERCWIDSSLAGVDSTRTPLVAPPASEPGPPATARAFGLISAPPAEPAPPPPHPQRRAILHKRWEPAPLALQAPASRPVYLIVANRENTIDILKDLGAQPGVDWIVIKEASLLPKITPLEYDLDFSDHRAGSDLIEQIIRQHPTIDGLIDFADLHAEPQGVPDRDEGRIAVLQGLLRQRASTALRVLHVTRGLAPFQGHRPTLAGARMAGIVKTVGAEHRKVRAATIDIEHGWECAEELLELAVREAFFGLDVAEVCYRQGARYAPRFVEVGPAGKGSRDPGATDQLGPFTLDFARVYVITGATGGLGAEVAQLLVQRGARKLALLSQRALPGRDAWPGGPAPDAEDPLAEARLTRLTALEALGPEIALYCGALTDGDRLKGFFEHVQQRLGPIGGVIHCAGAIDHNMSSFAQKDIAAMRSIWEPKIEGLVALRDALEGAQPDFFILYSSVSAAVPALGVGMADYASANSFVDAFAAYHQCTTGRRCLALNWPSWRDTGMGVQENQRYLSLGFTSHSTADGLDLLEEALHLPDLTSVLPCVVDASRFDSVRLLQAKAAGAPAAPAPERQQERPAPERWDSEPRAAPAAAARPDGVDADTFFETVRGRLLELLSRELMIPKDRIQGTMTFDAYGVDSIVIADLVRKMERFTGRPVEPGVILEYPTLDALSRFISENYKDSSLSDVAQRRDQAAVVQPVAPPAVTASRAAPPPRPPAASQERSAPTPAAQATRGAASGAPRRRIAVIGVACRFPGAPDAATFLDNLRHGRSSITEVPPDRWNVARLYRPSYEKGKSISKWGGFIEGIEYFDPGHYGIHEEDAEHIDPLMRLFIECGEQVMRDAGYDKPDVWGKRVGVFVGSGTTNYGYRIRKPTRSTITGVNQNFIAAYAAHIFNLKGPNMVVDTACSSSLVSVHLACQALLSEDCDVAIAGGADLLLDEVLHVRLSEAKALSPDGRCYTFDAKANGFVPGEGCGAVLLKPLDRAVADGDRIYAIIEGSAVNNDGHTMGLTTPNMQAQEELILSAHERAGTDPATVSYIEAHGTGTMIGDPIELKALTNVFRRFTDERQFCGVGSVKTNIGHLLLAAGIANLIKIALSLEHGVLCPTINCDEPNPRFSFSTSPFFPVRQARPWEPRRGVRRAGVSAFGFGGTNCHIVVRGFEPAIDGERRSVRQPLPPAVLHKKRYWVEPLSVVGPPESLTSPAAPPASRRPLLVLEEEKR